MTLSQKTLDTIHWTRISIVTHLETQLLILECDTQQQAIDFLSLLNENEFKLSFRDSNKGLPALVITFTTSQLNLFIIPSADTIFKHLSAGKIPSMTTGFAYGESTDVAYLNDRISINGLYYQNLN